MSSGKRREALRSFPARIIGGWIAGSLVASLLSFLFLSHQLDRFLTSRLDESLKTDMLDLAPALGNGRVDVAAATEKLEQHALTRGHFNFYLRLFDEEGNVVATSDLENWSHLADEIPRADPSEILRFQTRRLEGHPKGIRSMVFHNPGAYLLEIGVDMAETRSARASGIRVFAGTLLFALVLGSIMGWAVSRGPLRGVASVSRVARHVTEEIGFSQRVPLPTGSLETDRMADAFNTMLDKIAGLIQGQKEMTDNIAHDIRSPVARMRAGAEVALRESESSAISGQVIEDCDRILNLVDTLLEISSTEAGIVRWNLQRLDMARVADDAAELFSPVFEDKDQILELELAEGSFVEVDESVLQRVVANLLDNAIKYTGRSCRIQLSVSRQDAHVVLVVGDRGPGIPADEIAMIFKRFYRREPSRSTPGSGLGLCFCKAAVEAMGGRIDCLSEVGIGTRFEVKIPIAT